MNGRKIFDMMAGAWKINRKILNSQSKFTRGEGTATFRKRDNDENAMLYREELTLYAHFDKISASKEYIFRYKEDETISVYFNEQPERFFYTLNFPQLNSGKSSMNLAEGEHLCGNDLYMAEYVFVDYNQFQLSYQVNGPQKGYRLITLYNRESF